MKTFTHSNATGPFPILFTAHIDYQIKSEIKLDYYCTVLAIISRELLPSKFLSHGCGILNGIRSGDDHHE